MLRNMAVPLDRQKDRIPERGIAEIRALLKQVYPTPLESNGPPWRIG